VGSGAQEQNGTFDMMGNVWEWNETLIPVSHRGMRGGAFYTVGGDIGYFESSFSGPLRTPYYEYDNVGFRIASVPEPATLALLGLGGLVLRRSRK
jgi:formylglycine-generating enzyme required for sulfatase activity